MTKSTLTLAAALLAGTTLSSAANAGGIRVGFGFPLGSFIAHSAQSYNAEPSYGRHCDKPSHVARHEEYRPAHKVDVADDEPAPRKIKKTPKIETADETPASAPIKTAKLEDKNVVSDVTPSIYVPETPVTNFTGTQSTPSPLTTSSTTPAVVKDEAKVDEPKVEKVEKIDKVEKTDSADKDEPKAKIASSTAKRLCRRFSAAVAGLIDVPCE
jgi:hypothetical protein